MGRISSRTTFYYKRIFPIVWFGFLAVFLTVSVFNGLNTGRYPPLPFFIGPVIMTVFGYFVMKKLIFDLVDEVVDLGDTLLIKNGNQEERVALSDIMNVNYSALVSPPRVTLSMRKPSKFGAQITFCAPIRFVPFATSPAINGLIARVDAARRKQ
jgi:hypothetical protein